MACKPLARLRVASLEEVFSLLDKGGGDWAPTSTTHIPTSTTYGAVRSALYTPRDGTYRQEVVPCDGLPRFAVLSWLATVSN